MPYNQLKGPTKAEADCEQTGPEHNCQDWGWMGGKVMQGEGGKGNRVKLREQKGDRKESSQAKKPRQRQ